MCSDIYRKKKTGDIFFVFDRLPFAAGSLHEMAKPQECGDAKPVPNISAASYACMKGSNGYRKEQIFGLAHFSAHAPIHLDVLFSERSSL
jgi:hypothetical protein